MSPRAKGRVADKTPAAIGNRLPRLCECGGKLVHVRDFGRVFTHCLSCTPVVTINPDAFK